MTELHVLEITFDDDVAPNQVYEAREAIEELLESMGFAFAIEYRVEEVDTGDDDD